MLLVTRASAFESVAMQAIMDVPVQQMAIHTCIHCQQGEWLASLVFAPQPAQFQSSLLGVEYQGCCIQTSKQSA
jgi:hypothetical protein